MTKINKRLNIALEDLADKLENVQWHGEYFAASCAFHSPDVRPSMMVYRDGYNCMGCGSHGPIERLALKLNSTNRFIVQVKQTGRVLPSWYNWLRMFGTWENLVDDAHNTVLSNSQYRTFFRNRGIYDFVQHCRLGYIDGWYTFPVYDDKKNLLTIILRAGKSKNTDAKYVLRPQTSKDDHPKLYVPAIDWYGADYYKDLYVPFGIIDAITLRKIGLQSATGTTGKAINPSLFDEFRAPIWIIPDKGEDMAANALYSSLGWRGRVLKLDYPDGCKDSNDVLLMYGEEYLSHLIWYAKEKCVQTLHQKEH
jgi:hypothetical protein